MTETPKPPAPSRAVARYDGPRSTPDLQAYAMLLAFDTNPEGRYKPNNALPVAFRGNPAAVAFATEYAKALDVSPVTALIGMHIVDGKPTASAGLISGLVRRAGHKIRTWVEGSIEEGTAKGITTITRADDPDFEYRAEWTLDRAVRAGLMNRTADGRVVAAKPKSAWATYPENMLKSRSITECARDAAEDAILGVHYTPEELGVDVDESGDPVYTVTQVPDAPPPTPATPPTPAAPRPQEPSSATAAPEAAEDESGPESAANAPAVDLDAIVDECRSRILRARTLDPDLAQVWGNEPVLNSIERATNMRTHDHNGEECSILDLFHAASAAIRAGAPLLSTAQLGKLGLITVDADGIPVPADGIYCGGCGYPEDDCQCGDGDDANLADVERLLTRLQAEYPQAHEDVVAWAKGANVDLNTRDNAVAGEIVEAIASGDALGRSWIETLDMSPLELVGKLLGAEAIEETPPTAADLDNLAAHEAAEERRREAAEATPASRGSSAERRKSAAAEARRKVEESKRNAAQD